MFTINIIRTSFKNTHKYISHIHKLIQMHIHIHICIVMSNENQKGFSRCSWRVRKNCRWEAPQEEWKAVFNLWHWGLWGRVLTQMAKWTAEWREREANNIQKLSVPHGVEKADKEIKTTWDVKRGPSQPQMIEWNSFCSLVTELTLLLVHSQRMDTAGLNF